MCTAKAASLPRAAARTLHALGFDKVVSLRGGLQSWRQDNLPARQRCGQEGWQAGMTAADVIMYSTAWCGYCQRARSLLERKGVAVREIKVDEDPQDRETMLQKTAGGAPFRRSSSASGTSAAMTIWRRWIAQANWINCSARAPDARQPARADQATSPGESATSIGLQACDAAS